MAEMRPRHEEGPVTPQDDDMRMRRIAAARGSTKCSVRGCPVEIWDGRDTCHYHERKANG